MKYGHRLSRSTVSPVSLGPKSRLTPEITQTFAPMKKFKILIAESVFADDFYADNLEGHVVEAIAHVLHWDATYKIVLNAETLRRAIQATSRGGYDILHLSCHGDAKGIQLTDEMELSWGGL